MKAVLSICAVLALAGAANAAVSGSYDAAYGSAVSVQNAPTNFADSNLGLQTWANGSELNAAFVQNTGTSLKLLLTGNLETNYNKLEVFIDTGAPGQNQLRSDNAGVDFNGLNRMAGMRFDSAFTPRWWLTVTNGDTGGGNYGMFANAAELLPGGGGFGDYLGTNTGVGSGGSLSGGNNFIGASIVVNNSNTAGVTSGSGAGALSAVTGIEIEIPFASLGLTNTSIFRIAAFINGGGHDFVSNQVLGSLPSNFGNLGEPSLVDFSQYEGDQFFTVPTPGAMALLGLGGLAAARRRRA